jgi:NAD(P)-dependent dehydrogenase (short-subunit alcohol dehydrogenase family)
MKLCDLSGKIAIVTGGNQGIGLAIAWGLAGAGATVVIANRRADEGKKAAESLKKEGLSTAAIPVDISKLSSIEELVKKTMEKFGKIDILVNNAGVVLRKPALDFTEAEWDRIIDTNLKGTFFCCQAVGREMVKRQTGKIINVSSVVSQVAQVDRSVYSASKAGVSHLTRALALEWAPFHVNVNAIGPGVTHTDINRQYFKDHPEVLQAFIDDIPMGRAGNVDDCIGAVVFLASDASDFITGQTLLVDGGMTLH